MTSTHLDLWIGTYPVAGAGSPAGLGEGIWRARVDPATGTWHGARQVAELPAPSFLVAHPSGSVVYAVGETADGTVTALGADGVDLDDGLLRPLGTVRSGGDDPCHLLLAPGATALYVTNYSSGTVGVLPLAADGTWSEEVLAAGGPVQVFTAADSMTSGPGPEVDRQDGPHAHAALVAPGGRHLLVTDLGTDELRRYRIRGDGLLEADGIAARLPAGTGPRHLAAGPGGHVYVVGELDSTVHVLRWAPDTATAVLVQTVPACSTAPRPDGRGRRNLAAHLDVVDRRVLVSVRGADVLTSFAVSPGGSELTPLGEWPTGGTWPRHFAVVDGAVVAANQISSTVAVGTVGSDRPVGTVGTDRPVTPTEDGAAAEAVRHLLDLPAPACVVPVGV